MSNIKSSIVINKISFKSSVMIKTWPDQLSLCDDIISKFIGLEKMPVTGKFLQISDGYITCIAPGQYIVFSNNDKYYTEISALINSDIASLTDISHSRSGLTINGDQASDLLNKGLAIDLSNDNFPVGSATISTIHSIGVLFFKVENNNYMIFSYSSFSNSFFEWVIDCAKEYGYDLNEGADAPL